MRFLKSFQYAFRGIVYCINNERNMRVHTVAALYVFAFSFFFHLSETDYAVLFLTFAAVIMGEMFNTVAERLCDLVAASFNPVVRIIKNAASGGVLVGAAFSVCVAVSLFRQPEAFARMALFFGSHPVGIAAFAAVSAAAVVYIVLGPPGIRDRLKRFQLERKKRHG